MRNSHCFPTAGIFYLILLMIWAAAPAHAQIELNESGNAGIGPAGPKSEQALFVSDNEGPVSTMASAISVLADREVGQFIARYGVRSISVGKGYIGVGVYGVSGNAQFNYGLWGEGGGREGDVLYGLWARAKSQRSSQRAYGVYGLASGPSDSLYAGYFSGNVHITGTLSGASDRKFKRNVRNLAATAAPSGNEPALTRLLQLQPKRFRYKKDQYEEMGLPVGEQFGFVAQEVEAVFPTLVEEEVHPAAVQLGEDGQVIERGKPIRYKSVNYVQLIPLLIQGLKEQQAEIEALRGEVETLRAALQRQGIQVE